MKTLQQLVPDNIWHIKPYGFSQNDAHSHGARISLHANENPYNKPFNRYPAPSQAALRTELSKVKQVPAENIFPTNGTDEAIDLVYRIFCRPQQDNVVAISPTYGMYRRFSDIHGVEYRPVLLDDNFQLCAEKMLATCDTNTKVMWLCSPNNPTGNSLNGEEIRKILAHFDGIVVIDEAYSDFSAAEIFRTQIAQWPNLIVLNTMSVAWGCAAIRLGMAFASTEIVDLMNKVKLPYNISQLSQQHALEALRHREDVEKWVAWLLQERRTLMNAFSLLPICERVYPSDANFFLAKMTNAKRIYTVLADKGIDVCNISNAELCHNCLRITIGTKGENTELLSTLRQYQ